MNDFSYQMGNPHTFLILELGNLTIEIILVVYIIMDTSLLLYFTIYYIGANSILNKKPVYKKLNF